MIDQLKYGEVQNISNGLKKEISIIQELIKNKNIQELVDFLATVEGYSKYLDTTIEINKDADKALEELTNKIKKPT